MGKKDALPVLMGEAPYVRASELLDMLDDLRLAEG
jgi:hypothetical protein